MDPDSSQIQPDIILTSGDLIVLAVSILELFLTAYFARIQQALSEVSHKFDHIFEDEKECERITRAYSGTDEIMFKAFHCFALLSSAACSAYFSVDITKDPATAVISLLLDITLWCIADSLPRRYVSEKNTRKIIITGVFPSTILKVLLFPISWLMRILSGEDGESSVTEEEIMMMVEAGNESGDIEESEREMINNVFEFHDTAVSEVMTHRTDVLAVDISDDISDIVYKAINSGFSRIPVCDKDIDHIVGLIHVKDLLCLVGVNDMTAFSVKSFVRDTMYVPETCMCDELFKTFTSQRSQFAVVVDEYGGTSGIVTMEDIVESIFGSIQDEYDDEPDEISEVSDNVFIIDGNARPEDVFETLGIDEPKDMDYDTIGAFVTGLIGHLPKEEEHPEVRYGNVVFSVILAEDMKIEKIKALVEDRGE